MNKISNALQCTTDTKELIIGEGITAQTGKMFKRLFPGEKAIIVADNNTWIAAGKAVQSSLVLEEIEQDSPFIFTEDHFHAEWKYVEELEEVLKKTDAIAIAVGSGVINDLTKLVSFHCNKQYICVATAASMDGYTAFGSSITYQGNKQAYDCPAPVGCIFDPEIAAIAPKELAASGYADLIAKIPAGADWMLADAVGAEKLDAFSWDLVHIGLRESLATPQAVFNGELNATEALGEGLIMSGFAMQAHQSSRPASGTEHQFSHCWDMENLSFENQLVSHGFKVGIGTLVSTALIEFLLEEDFSTLDVEKCVDAWKSWTETEKDIYRIFDGKPGHISRALSETKNKHVSKAELREQLNALKSAWPDLKNKIQAQLIPFTEVRENLKQVGAPYEPEMIGVSRERLHKTLSYIPYMRSRFANIDIVFRCGLMEKYANKLFGRGGIWEINKKNIN